ncbi:MAG: hypothetical protein CSA31_01625 [Desulfobulbus propionicus]|nr:MAG: hypothetical protein CSA31_01625 [Desulfobulbus propionicus]
MRNKIEIDVWMKRNNMSVTKIQKALGYKTHTGISNTLAGREHLKKVVLFLVEKGCPVKHLDLPEHMMKREEAA